MTHAGGSKPDVLRYYRVFARGLHEVASPGLSTMGAMRQKPRTVIHCVGQSGQRVARLAIGKDWMVAAAYNRAGDKVGWDLARLIGLQTDPGVVVEDCGTTDFTQRDADIGVVMMTDVLRTNMPAYRRAPSAERRQTDD